MTYKIKHLPVNTLGRDFVCGDIHGSLGSVTKFLEFIQFDPSKDRLISVGDIVDRGVNSYGCLKLLDNHWFHMVLANHEDMMIDYLSPKHDFFNMGVYWFRNGGNWWTYGVTPEQRLDVMTNYLPIMEELPSIITVDMINGKKFHVIHAEFYPEGKITDNDLSDTEAFQSLAEVPMGDGECVLWGRSLFYSAYDTPLDDTKLRKLKKEVSLNKLDRHFNEHLSHIYSGHSVVRAPLRIGGQTNLDTGAYKSYCMDTGGYGQVKPIPTWAGLTVTEPLTDRFWRATDYAVVPSTLVTV